jgi:hypothetical protein
MKKKLCLSMGLGIFPVWLHFGENFEHSMSFWHGNSKMFGTISRRAKLNCANIWSFKDWNP